jgi:hypothetical protein
MAPTPSARTLSELCRQALRPLFDAFGVPLRVTDRLASEFGFEAQSISDPQAPRLQHPKASGEELRPIPRALA